jgi:hypothetical protein
MEGGIIVQLTYAANPALGFAGMIGEGFTSPKQIDSKLAETTALAFGVAVERGTDQATQSVALATLTNWSGIVVAASNVEVATGATGSYGVEAPLPVMIRGRIFVTAGGAVVVGARVEPSLGAATKFSTVAVPTLGVQLVATALTAAAADGDLMLIELHENTAAGQPLA